LTAGPTMPDTAVASIHDIGPFRIFIALA